MISYFISKLNQKNIKKVKACNDEEYFAARIADDSLQASGARYDMKIMRIENAALEQIADDVLAVKERYGADRVAVCKFIQKDIQTQFHNNSTPITYSL